MHWGVGSDGQGKAQWLGVQEGKSAIFVWGGGWWDRLHFSNGRSKSNDPPSHNRINMTIKRRTTGFGLKRPGDGVASSFCEGILVEFLGGGG